MTRRISPRHLAQNGSTGFLRYKPFIVSILGGLKETNRTETRTRTNYLGAQLDFSNSSALADRNSNRTHLYAHRQDRGCSEISMKNKLKVLRAERDWSQKELGRRVGVSRQAINAIERGKFDSSLPLAFKLADLFNLPIEEIFLCEAADKV